MGIVERARAAVSGLLDEVLVEAPIWEQFGRIGGNLSTAEITQIIREADAGQISRLVDLTHESRQKDGHLHAILQTRELGLQGLEWDVVAPGDDASAADKQAAEDAKEALRQCQTFPTTIGHVNGESCLFGYASAETIWRVETENPQLRGKLVPDRFERMSCRRFGFRTTDGALLYSPSSWTSTVDVDGIDLLEEFPLGKFLFVRNRRINGDVQIREGLCRVLVWAALFRNWGVRDWLQLGEIGWKPHRKGKYQKNAAKEDISRLQRALQSFTASQVVALPETVDLTMDWPKGLGGLNAVHRELCEFIGGEMSKAVLGQTLTTESGNRGARSLGEVHNQIRRDILEADAAEIAGAVREQIIKPFVRVNYGESVSVPEFFFLTEEPTDIEAFAAAIEKLVKAGLRIPSSYVRDKVGMPAPLDDDEVLEPAATVAPMPGGSPDEPPPEDDGDNADDDSPEA